MSLYDKLGLSWLGNTTIRIFKKENMSQYKIHYYTFLDAICNDYVIVNKNFIELTSTQSYFILTSGQIDGVRYDEYLKNKGIKGVFIHSDDNSYVEKFNLMKKYLEKNTSLYEKSLFCKIDTDFVHYRVNSFQKLITELFIKNERLFVGNKKNRWVRGALNAIHVDSILKCPCLEKTRWNEFDDNFTTTLTKNKIVDIMEIMFFEKSDTILKNLYGTHVNNPNKAQSVLKLNQDLGKEFPNIYE